MGFDTANKILDFIKQTAKPSEIINITFHGGEPLLNINLIKYIIEEVKKDFKNVLFSLTTNGTILNEEISNFLVENFKNGFSMSIDGNQFVHDTNRIYPGGQGSFDTVMRNLYTYFDTSYFGKITIRMTLTAGMVDYLFDSCMFLIKRGFSTIITSLDFSDKSWTYQKLEDLKVQVQMIYNEAIRNEYSKNAINLSLLDWNNHKKGICTISYDRLVIDVNGDSYPCIASVGDKSLIIGSVYTDPLNNKQRIDYLRKINEADNFECKGCDYKEYCVTSRCKFCNKAYTGEFLSPSTIECGYQNMIIDLQNQYS